MNKQNPAPNNLSMDVLAHMYSNFHMQTKEPQPLYILYRDTIRTFLYEKAKLLGLNSRILGIFGINVTIIIALFTCTFHDFWILKGDLIKGIFIAFLIIFGLYLLYNCKVAINNLKKLTIDNMVEELGARGTTISSSSMINLKEPINSAPTSYLGNIPLEGHEQTDEVPDFLVGKWSHKVLNQQISETINISKDGKYFIGNSISPTFHLNKFNLEWERKIITFNKVNVESGKKHSRERLEIKQNGILLVGNKKGDTNDKHEYKRYSQQSA